MLMRFQEFGEIKRENDERTIYKKQYETYFELMRRFDENTY